LRPGAGVPHCRDESRGILSAFQAGLSCAIWHGRASRAEVCGLRGGRRQKQRGETAQRRLRAEMMAICRQLSEPRGAGRSGWRRRSAAGSPSSG
jgi:hypothetical protein